MNNTYTYNKETGILFVVDKNVDYPFSLNRRSYLPLDPTSCFNTLEEAEAYASNDFETVLVPYEGQIISVIENNKAYILKAVQDTGSYKYNGSARKPRLHYELVLVSGDEKNQFKEGFKITNKIGALSDNGVSEVKAGDSIEALLKKILFKTTKATFSATISNSSLEVGESLPSITVSADKKDQGNVISYKFNGGDRIIPNASSFTETIKLSDIESDNYAKPNLEYKYTVGVTFDKNEEMAFNSEDARNVNVSFGVHRCFYAGSLVQNEMDENNGLPLDDLSLKKLKKHKYSSSTFDFDEQTAGNYFIVAIPSAWKLDSIEWFDSLNNKYVSVKNEAVNSKYTISNVTPTYHSDLIDSVEYTVYSVYTPGKMKRKMKVKVSE